ncbi:hypothetical protein GCM10027417_23790 [Glutamicibacter endophyticus]
MSELSSPRVSPAVSALYAVVAFLLEVGLLFGAAMAAMAFLPWPRLVSAIVVVVPLLVIWGLLISPKAVVRLRLRTRIILMHLIYLVGAYVLWLSVDHYFVNQNQIWAIIMLVLTGLSALLVLATRGYVVPHRRDKRSAPVVETPNDAETKPRSAPRGRRAAR